MSYITVDYMPLFGMPNLLARLSCQILSCHVCSAWFMLWFLTSFMSRIAHQTSKGSACTHIRRSKSGAPLVTALLLYAEKFYLTWKYYLPNGYCYVVGTESLLKLYLDMIISKLVHNCKFFAFEVINKWSSCYFF
jgi:hypothetical protein